VPREDNFQAGHPVKTAPKRISGTNQRSGAESQRKEVIQMRTKLFGAFIAALSIAAFAALPSMAMAESVILKEGSENVEVGETLRATSTNTTFTGRTSGRAVECAKTSIRGQVRENPGARITFREGGVFEGADKTDRCAVSKTEGRIKARVENVKFRKDITLTKEGTHVRGRTEARFTFRFFDRKLEPNGPIAVCNYHDKIEVRSESNSDVFHAKSETDARLEEKGNVGECDEKGALRGDFRLTRRDGTTAVKNN
jgi:hypothetical protein